ncbi:hypothetical protein IE077_001633 [Cardiosporidium cionae]|uniref:Uncharacterized protein n=1 Tax=Cardiosporidium cionae TaxID=476202 RepID=A0ABQ7JCR9_9APIC|nr:hypothetical protein IE077_001633 [Cardiosporidium cionae]|eukprot:KAF8821748.1 hypothetical protein IE077_001633 [Cardiosporidium cionae]
MDESVPRSGRGLHMWHAMENLNPKATRGPERGLKQPSFTSRNFLSKMTPARQKLESGESFENTSSENPERLTKNIVVPFGSNTEKPLYVSHGKDGYMKEYWVNEWIGDIRRQVFKLLHKQTWHAQFTRPCDRRVVTRTFSVRNLGENAARAKAYNMMPWETGDPELRRPLGRPTKRYHFLPNDFDETVKRPKMAQTIEKSDIVETDLDEWSACMHSFSTTPSFDGRFLPNKIAKDVERNISIPSKPVYTTEKSHPATYYSHDYHFDKFLNLLDEPANSSLPAMELDNDLFGTVPAMSFSSSMKGGSSTLHSSTSRGYSSTHPSPVHMEDPPIYSALSSVFQPFSAPSEEAIEGPLPAVTTPTSQGIDGYPSYQPSTSLRQCSVAKLFCYFCNNIRNREALGTTGYKKVLSILFPDPYAHKVSFGPSGAPPDIETLLDQRNLLEDYILVNRVLHRLAEKEEASLSCSVIHVGKDSTASLQQISFPHSKEQNGSHPLFSHASTSSHAVHTASVQDNTSLLTANAATSSSSTSTFFPMMEETAPSIPSFTSQNEETCTLYGQNFMEMHASPDQGEGGLPPEGAHSLAEEPSEVILSIIKTENAMETVEREAVNPPPNRSSVNGVETTKFSIEATKIGSNGPSEIHLPLKDMLLPSLSSQNSNARGRNVEIYSEDSLSLQHKPREENVTEESWHISPSEPLLPLMDDATPTSLWSHQKYSGCVEETSSTSSPLPTVTAEKTEEVNPVPSCLHSGSTLCSTPSTSLESPILHSIHTYDEETIKNLPSDSLEKKIPSPSPLFPPYRSEPTTSEIFRVLAWLLS